MDFWHEIKITTLLSTVQHINPIQTYMIYKTYKMTKIYLLLFVDKNFIWKWMAKMRNISYWCTYTPYQLWQMNSIQLLHRTNGNYFLMLLPYCQSTFDKQIIGGHCFKYLSQGLYYFSIENMYFFFEWHKNSIKCNLNNNKNTNT